LIGCEFNSPFSGAANTGEQYGAVEVFIELTNCIAPLFEACLAIYSLEPKAVRLKRLLNQIEHFGPVTENDTNND
jgi:hypothetical protein